MTKLSLLEQWIICATVSLVAMSVMASPTEDVHNPGASRSLRGHHHHRSLNPSVDCEARCNYAGYERLVLSADANIQGLIQNSPMQLNNDGWWDVSCWDTSRVKSMKYAFKNFPLEDLLPFGYPLHCWDTSSVTNMSGMFSGASKFNQPLDHFVTSSVTDMSGMFRLASSFD